jgi:hypothetical protein
MYSREGTLTKNLRNISPIFGREELKQHLDHMLKK